MREVDVDGMLRRIPFGLFVEWQAYGSLEPFGEHRADWRFGKLTADLINFQRDRKRNPRARPVKDFLLRFVDEIPEPVKKDWRTVKAAFMEIMERHKAAMEQAKQRREAREARER